MPVYYTEDLDVYVRAGYLPNGELMTAVFNLSLDVMDDIPLYTKNKVSKIEMLNPNGERVPLEFSYVENELRINKRLGVLETAILFLS